MDAAKILLIDDEFPIRYLVEHQLQRKGFTVMSAKDGRSGIEAALVEQPSLILLDVMMPELDGFEVCQMLRSHPDTSHIPIIFLTACATKEHKLQAFKLGADDYLTKPFQADELEAHIMAVLRRHRPQEKPATPRLRAPIISLFSPKGGVGTTTLAIQLSEAMALRQNRQVLLMDLDLPLGGVAPALNLFTRYHVMDLLSQPVEKINVDLIRYYAQQHRANLWVSPTPGELQENGRQPSPATLEKITQTITESGQQAILDLGAHMNKFTLAAMRLSDVIFVVTSGQSVSNKLLNAFINSAPQLGLEPRRMLPVINELHGPTDTSVELARVPVARIPHTSERSRTRLWLRDQGLQKLVSVIS